MHFNIPGYLLTLSTLTWAAALCVVLLTLSTFALLFDKGARREPPHYLLPCRGTVYLAILVASGVLLVGALFLKIKYFP